mgnify:CR=1 FL=1
MKETKKLITSSRKKEDVYFVSSSNSNYDFSHMGKKLKYKFVDFHSSRPGHDLRYALDGDKLKKMGWQPQKNIKQRNDNLGGWSMWKSFR